MAFTIFVPDCTFVHRICPEQNWRVQIHYFFLSIEKIKQFLKAMFPLYRRAFLADTKSGYPV